MIVDGRALYPDKSNAELEDMVEEAAKYEGIYTLARQWRVAAVRKEEEALRQQRVDEFTNLFPSQANPQGGVTPPAGV